MSAPSWDNREKRSARLRGVIAPLARRYKEPGSIILSVGGEQVDNHGNLIPHTELHSFMSNGVCEPEEYFSVEKKSHIHQTNARYSRANWIRGDIFSVFHWLKHTKNIRGINLDTMGTLNTIGNKLIQLLNDDSISPGTIISINMISWSRRLENFKLSYLPFSLAAVRPHIKLFSRKYIVRDDFEYQGGIHTVMRTIVLERQ